MNTYVEVPREALEAKLRSMGFTRDDVRGEVTYSRRHDKDHKLRVTVYTSVAEFSDKARAKDADAIRVVGQLVWSRRGETVERRKCLYKAKILRVTSVEGVLERVHAKAREAYAALNEFQQEQRGRQIWNAQERVLAPAKYVGPPIQVCIHPACSMTTRGGAYCAHHAPDHQSWPSKDLPFKVPGDQT